SCYRDWSSDVCSSALGALIDANGQPVRDARGLPLELAPNQKQRAALLLSPLIGAHKTLFIGISGGEVPGDPHGWMVTVDVDTFSSEERRVGTGRCVWW